MRLHPLCRALFVWLLSICGSAFLPLGNVWAADGSWTGDSGNWSDSTKWLAGVIAHGSDTLAQFLGGPVGEPTVTLDSLRTVGDLEFSARKYTIAGESILFLDRTSGTPTIKAPTSIPIVISAQLAGTDGFMLIGSFSHLSLTGGNFYSGPTTIKGGTLSAIDGVGLPLTSNLSFDETSMGGGVALYESSGTFSRYLGTAPGQLQWNSHGGFAAYGGPLAVLLNFASTVTWGVGSFVPMGHTLQLGSDTADDVVDFQNPIDLNGGQRQVQYRDNSASSTDAVVISGRISNGDLAVSESSGGSTPLILTGDNTYGNTILGGGAIQIGNGGLTGSLGTGTVSGAGRVLFNRSDAMSVPNEISQAVSVIHNGTGVTALSGICTYTGNTDVNAGTLLVTGSLTGTQVNVNAGAFGGTGSVTTSDKPFNLEAGAKLSPGTSAGTLTVNTGTAAMNIVDAVTPTNSQSLLFELATPGASDQLLLTGGTLEIGAGLLEFDDFAFSALPGFAPGIYTLVDGVNLITGTLGPALTGTVGGQEARLALADGGNDLILVVPEPSSILLASLAALAGLLSLHRPA